MLTVIIGAVLLHASLEDIRRRDIGSIHVVVLYILISFYIVITGNLGLHTTYVFLFAFILFMSISIFSRGQFGIGDSLVIGALALYFHDFLSFQNYLYAVGIIMVPWGAYWMIHYRKNNSLHGVLHGFKRTVPIDKVCVGDVLSTDNFMHGLTRIQIDKMRHDGYVSLEIKSPFPFIPVLFIAFIVTLFI
jgi:prepilin signal peptidase PulO-like enzyme (type II secretory pathway)